MFSKEEIKKRVVDQLYWDSRVDASDIFVEIDGSTVILHGSVPTAYARQSAESDAWAVPGVHMVENKIVVQIQQPLAPSPGELRDNIRNVFQWDPALSQEDIIITVDNGLIILQGAVGSYWQKKLAEQKVQNIAGVLVVENKIAVTPTHDILDEIIAQNIIEALDRNVDMDIDQIDVKVEKGRVTLSGKVPDWNAYKAAETIVYFTSGVTDLQNELVITPLAM